MKVVALLLAIVLTSPAHAAPYDPLKVDAASPQTIDITFDDAARHRSVPLLVYLPAAVRPAPVVLFSHGLGGSREGSVYLGRHWAGRGYVAIFVQHPGSDDSVWRNLPAEKRMAALREGASAKNLLLRVGDVKAVLDRLREWNADGPLKGRLDATRVGMSGHSFGAVTTQWVSGESLGGRRLADDRIKAAVIMSPSGPRRGGEVAFRNVRIPWMLMTGTQDVAPIGVDDVAMRLAVFPALPPGDKYELVLDGALHSAFTDRALPGDKGPRNPNHHRAILALSTAFWDAFLRDDAAARAWLDGSGARTVLQPKDAWQRK